MISRATPSKTPYFPKKLPIIFVAALATLLLSCGVIATGEILRSPGSVVSPAVSVAAAPPQEAAAKAAPALPSLGVPVAAIGDAAKRVLETANQGRRIAVLGSAPGAGGTSLAALTFARALSKEKRTILVGLPAASAMTNGVPDLAVVSSNPRAPGLSDVVRGKAPISAAITRDRLSKLHLVTAGTPTADAIALTKSMAFLTAIEALARSYDFIVIELGCGSRGHACARRGDCSACTRDRASRCGAGRCRGGQETNGSWFPRIRRRDRCNGRQISRRRVGHF